MKIVVDMANKELADAVKDKLSRIGDSVSEKRLSVPFCLTPKGEAFVDRRVNDKEK